MDPRDDAALDAAMARFGALIRRMDERQTRIANSLARLYQIAFAAFAVLVASVSFLTIILARQVPQITAVITDMNDRFASVAEDMVIIERRMRGIDTAMQTLPRVVGEVDRVHLSVAFMSNDVALMSGSIGSLDDSIGLITASVGDMRQSFEVMQHNVAVMGRDVNHMSQPMRMFNWMNPFR